VLARVRGDAHRIAHVVETVEEADQVIGPGEILRSGHPNVVRLSTPASAARSRAVSIDGGW